METNSTNSQEKANAPIAGMQSYSPPFVSLYNEDCLETIRRIPDGSVDLILTDPPYNTTDCKWDKIEIFSDDLKKQWLRILSDTGNIVVCCQEIMMAKTIIFLQEFYRHRLIWQKDKCGNFLSASGQPLKYTEDIVVFSKRGHYKVHNSKIETATYNPIMRNGSGKAKGTDSQRFGLSINAINDREKKTPLKANPKTDGIERYPQDIIYFPVPHNKNERIHPTQKPLDLMRYLVLTYSNKGDTVFDGYSGSGTTAIACVVEQRNFIGSELNKDYFNKSVQRIKNVPQSLF
jgi:site-specific DNA-methyltransferase (adenine-specific)